MVNLIQADRVIVKHSNEIDRQKKAESLKMSAGLLLEDSGTKYPFETNFNGTLPLQTY